jgi:hypothetical protein
MDITTPSYTDDVIKNTELFLKEIVGSYIKVVITNNQPSIELSLNKTMIESNYLSDNLRCYTGDSVPSIEREHRIWEVFEDLCRNRKIKDSVLLIGLGDFPIIMKDRTMHPHYDRFPGKYNLYPPKLSIVASRSVIRSLHDDILFPSRDYLDTIYTIDSNIRQINHDFKNKKPIAVFRGTITGNLRTINNPRVMARILSLSYPRHLNVELTRTFTICMNG